MEAILDFSTDLDVSVLDRVVTVMFASTGAEQKQAQTVLAQFQEHPDAWQRVPTILSTSDNSQTKYLSLQILDKLISTRWKTLPQDQQLGVPVTSGLGGVSASLPLASVSGSVP
ncbi:unnamed protein product [Tilletia controversa]|nr:unnamed protein product [Tilletia controversa]